MTSLVDQVIERRTAYIRRLNDVTKRVVTGNIEKDCETLILRPLEKARGTFYFDEMHAMVSGMPFNWETLSVIPEIAEIKDVQHHTLAGQLEQVRAVVDNYYRMLLEPLASIPFFYSNPSLRVEPNCVGAAQIIAALYGYENKMDDLEMLVVNSSKRRDTLLNTLRNYDKLPRVDLADGHWVTCNVDSFRGDFREDELQDKLLDQVLLMEESNHVTIRKNNGEVLDFPIEKDNIKRFEYCGINEGILATGMAALVVLYQHLNLPAERQWDRVREKAGKASKIIAASVDYSLGKDCFEELREVFREDLPARYILVEASIKGDKKFTRSAIEHVRDTYNHPDAMRIVWERYLGEEGYNQIIVPELNLGGRNEFSK